MYIGITKGLGYIDRKMIYVSKKENAQISLLVNITRPSVVWLCECQKGFLKYPSKYMLCMYVYIFIFYYNDYDY
jgi:hypothetical protein